MKEIIKEYKQIVTDKKCEPCKGSYEGICEHKDNCIEFREEVIKALAKELDHTRRTLIRQAKDLKFELEIEKRGKDV